MHKKSFSLVLVYNKDNLEKICNTFKEHNIDIISTGLTAKYIKKIGYNCFEVSHFTKFNEILEGIRVFLNNLRGQVKHINGFMEHLIDEILWLQDKGWLRGFVFGLIHTIIQYMIILMNCCKLLKGIGLF